MMEQEEKERKTGQEKSLRIWEYPEANLSG
jgi:hypothetical protein